MPPREDELVGDEDEDYDEYEEEYEEADEYEDELDLEAGTCRLHRLIGIGVFLRCTLMLHRVLIAVKHYVMYLHARAWAIGTAYSAVE